MVFTWQKKEVEDDRMIKKDHCSLTVACIRVGQTRTIAGLAKDTQDQMDRMGEALSSRTFTWKMRQGNKYPVRRHEKLFK